MPAKLLAYHSRRKDNAVNVASAYFQIPKHLITSRLFAKLKPCTKDVLLFLLYKFNSSKTAELCFADEDIALETGLSTRSMRLARSQLVEYNLVRNCVRYARGFIYEMHLDYSFLVEGRKPRRPAQPAPQPQAVGENRSPKWNEIGH